MRQRGKTKVFLVGASMGGIASLVAGANVKPAVDGVVSVSAPARFLGMDAVATAPRLRVPVLYLAAEGDDNAGYDFSKDAEDARGDSGDRQAARGPAGLLHGVALVGRLGAREGADRGVPQGALTPGRGLAAPGECTLLDRGRCRSPCRAGPPRDGGCARCVLRAGLARRAAGGCGGQQVLLPVVDELVEKVGGEVHGVS